MPEPDGQTLLQRDGLRLNVFTYGSLMYPEVWDRVVAGRYRSAVAVLKGFSRRELVGVTYPGAIPLADSLIEGRVYFDVGARDLARLDAFEAAEYRRDEVTVTLAGEPAVSVRAQLYVYLDAARVAPQEWDAQRFEREHLAGFADEHGGDASRRAAGRAT